MTASYTATLPAGKYYVGDTCYVLSDADSDLLFKSLTAEQKRTGKWPQFHTMKIRGFTVVVGSTTYGDGTYDSYTDPRVKPPPTFDVDSGQIGMVPAGLICSRKRKHRDDGDFYLNSKKEPIEFSLHRGKFKISYPSFSLWINTGDPDDD